MALRVLVIDDSTVMRKVIFKALKQAFGMDEVQQPSGKQQTYQRRVLRRKNIDEGPVAGVTVVEVYEAADGAEALHQFDQSVIDLLLVDWNMPNMGGLEFVKNIRQFETSRHTPIIMVTAEGDLTRAQEAWRYGIDGYLVKPFTPERLKEKMFTVLRLRGHQV